MRSETPAPVEQPDIDADHELIRGLAQEPVPHILLAVGVLEKEIAQIDDVDELRRRLRHHAKALRHVGLELMEATKTDDV
jgi:hypothetical protein